MNRQRNSSWESASSWYDGIVGKEGHFYHREVVFPRILELMHLKKGDHLLDLGCGQGVLAGLLPKGVDYLGIDLSRSLIAKAKKQFSHSFLHKDVTKPLNLKKEFSHATIILALQNMESPLGVFKNAKEGLKKSGSLFVVLNHPYFRIPRQSSWEVDEKKKLQYRRVDTYMSPMKIPIQTHPGQSKETTLSFHYPLSTLIQEAAQAGLCLKNMEEWCSPKTSSGKKAKMENRARSEFPLFMLLEFVIL